MSETGRSDHNSNQSLATNELTVHEKEQQWPDLAGRLQENGHVLPLRVYYEDTDFSREDFVVNINGRPAAKVMIVITQGYLNYCSTRWSVNKKLSIALAGKIQEMYPGLLRKILPVEGRRYNQDLHPQSLLIEVGYQKNTTAEAVYTGELLAYAIAELLREEPVFLLDKRQME